MIIKAKVLPFSDRIHPPIFSNNHKQYLMEKNKNDLSKILRGKKPNNQRLKRYLNKISEIKNIEGSKLIASSLNKSYSTNANLNSTNNKSFNNDEDIFKFKRSKKSILKKKKSKPSLTKLKSSSNNLSPKKLFSILDGTDYKQLRSGVKYKYDEE